MHEPVIDARTAAAIAAGMQAVALADGEVHPRELELIGAFRAEIPDEVDPSNVRITDDAVREVLVRSLVMVAVADGRISDEERAVVREIAHAHGATDALLARVEAEVKRELLGVFEDVRVFRDDVDAIARELGVEPG